jgi:pimeloyl-ACP methyl ester carboxylesterase
MGGGGEDFAADLKVAADQHGWVLVAPTIAYGDWTDPTQVAREDAMLIEWLATYLQQLPEQTGLQIDPGVLVLGFSRGAQLAHRFAEAYPRRVRCVAALSAGTYTMPQVRAADGTVLSFPFGVGDFPSSVGRPFQPEQLRSVRFWVGVGGVDTNPDDVPRQWDAYEGDDRLDRAQAFVAALSAIDVSARLTVFPDAPHDLPPRMRGAAIAFLGS